MIKPTTVKDVTFGETSEDKVVVINQQRNCDDYKEKALDLIRNEVAKAKETSMQNAQGDPSSDHTRLLEKKSTDLIVHSQSRKSYASSSLVEKKDQLQKLIGQKRDNPDTDRFTIEKDLIELSNLLAEKKRNKKALITAQVAYEETLSKLQKLKGRVIRVFEDTDSLEERTSSQK